MKAMAAIKHIRTTKTPTTEPTISPVLVLASLVADVLTKMYKNYFYKIQDIDARYDTSFLSIPANISFTSIVRVGILSKKSKLMMLSFYFEKWNFWNLKILNCLGHIFPYLGKKWKISKKVYFIILRASFDFIDIF